MQINNYTVQNKGDLDSFIKTKNLNFSFIKTKNLNLSFIKHLNHLYSGRYSDSFIKTDNLNLYQSCFKV